MEEAEKLWVAGLHYYPERFCASGKFLRVSTKLAPKQEKGHKSGKILNSLESFRTVCKVSGQSGKFLDSLESFWTVWRVCGQSGKFPERLESFRIAFYFFGQFSDSQERLTYFFKMSWKRFTHFWHTCREIKIYALRPESFCASKSADRKVETF